MANTQSEIMKRLVNRLNDVNLNNEIFSDRRKICKLINRVCKINNIACDWDWTTDRFILNEAYYLYQNSLKWFVLETV